MEQRHQVKGCRSGKDVRKILPQMLTWGQGINRFCINSIIQSQSPHPQAPNCFYLGSDLSLKFFIQFLFSEGKVLDLNILEVG